MFHIQSQQGTKQVHRIIDGDTGMVAIHEKTGKPLDGGGHTDPAKAARQCTTLNLWKQKKSVGKPA